MNVSETTWMQLLDELAYSQNLDPADGQVNKQFARRAARAVNAAIDYCWKIFPWRESVALCRQMENPVNAGDERPGDRYLGQVLQEGYEILRVYAEDPRPAWEAEDEPEVIDHLELQGQIRLRGKNNAPWYVCRMTAPRFSAPEFYDAGTTYRPGDSALIGGDVWLALKVTALNSALAAPETGFQNWEPGLYLEGAAEPPPPVADSIRHYGLIRRVAGEHTAALETEPGTVDVALWSPLYEIQPQPWAPQRLPGVLREAVLAGAESWLARTAEGQVMASVAISQGMDTVLGKEVLRRIKTQKQFSQLRSRVLLTV